MSAQPESVAVDLGEIEIALEIAMRAATPGEKRWLADLARRLNPQKFKAFESSLPSSDMVDRKNGHSVKEPV